MIVLMCPYFSYSICHVYCAVPLINLISATVTVVLALLHRFDLYVSIDDAGL